MSTIRQVLFWLHLSAGVVAGTVILLMSVTGVVLTYERQINEWTARHLRSVPPTAEARPLPIQDLLAIVQRTYPGHVTTGITVNARLDAPVIVAAERTPLYVDAYTGHALGERSGAGIRAFLSEMRSWHRWLAVEGENRPLARAITGWSNAVFLFIVASGMWIWVPRLWTWTQVRSVLLFRRKYGTSKARDFNWHNVIGIWSAIPLFIVVLGAVPISFPWASDLVYRVVGEEPPPRGRPGGPPGASAPAGRAARPDARAATGSGMPARTPLRLDGLNQLWARAAADQDGWNTIAVRFPRTDRDPLVFTIDRGDGGQPQLRSTLTLDRAGQVVARETFADQSLGRRLRSLLRFAHTGEVLGVAGQTVAGLVSAGAVVMVWTGLALTWRRYGAWLVRRRLATSMANTVTRPSAVSGIAQQSKESVS